MVVTYGTLPHWHRRLNSYVRKERLFLSLCFSFPSHTPPYFSTMPSPSLLLLLLLPWDPSSITLNSSSKPSTPPRPPPRVSPSLITILVLWVGCPLSPLCTHPPFQKVKSNTHTNTPALSSSPCPRRVEQKVVVISSPLGHNGRSCAAPTECNVLFWRHQGQSIERGTDWPGTPSRQTITLFPLVVCGWMRRLCVLCQQNDVFRPPVAPAIGTLK